MSTIRRIIGYCGIVLTLLVFVSAVSADHSHEFDSLDAKKGEQLYNTTCIACHGTDGKSAIPGVPNFRTSDSRLAVTEHLTLIKHIKEGYQSPGSMMAMPAKGGNPSLSDEDIADILEYMLQAFTTQK